jgi:hypothetical protein
MNFAALVLASAALLCFVALALGSPKAWLLPAGWALFVSSFVVQLVWQAHQVIAH